MDIILKTQVREQKEKLSVDFVPAILYGRGVASTSLKVKRGELNLPALYELSDDEVIQQLSTLNGVGRWTAEMLLIHCMERPDVISWGDIAIRRGMMRLYGLDNLTKDQFEQYRRGYAPCGSVASIYLWKLSAETKVVK